MGQCLCKRQKNNYSNPLITTTLVILHYQDYVKF